MIFLTYINTLTASDNKWTLRASINGIYTEISRIWLQRIGKDSLLAINFTYKYSQNMCRK